MTCETAIAAPSPELLLFAERVAETEPALATSEKRAGPRPPLFTTVLVQPLDADLAPLGPPLAALTRNISRHGLCILIEDWPQPNSLAVQLLVEGETCCLVTKEKWRKQTDSFSIVGLRTVKQVTAHTFERFQDGAFAASRAR